MNESNFEYGVGSLKKIKKDNAERWADSPIIAHLTWDAKHRLKELLRDGQIAQRIADEYYKDKLIWIAALPKSSSRGIENLIKTIQFHHLGGAENKAFTSLQPEQGEFFPRGLLRSDPDINYMLQNCIDGGVYRKHFAPCVYNLLVLDTLKCNYVVTLRHPADYIIGAYGHNNVRVEKPLEHFNMGIGPLDQSRFLLGHDLDDVIAYLINDGHLFDALNWMAKWLQYRKQDHSVAIRYEDVIDENKQEQVFAEVSEKFFQAPLSEGAISECKHVFDAQKLARKSGIVSDRYPKGWSGSVGIWKSYFNKSHIEDYNRIVSGFLSCCCNPELLLEAYPDILLK